jgi:DNA-binding LacI/PurR family transcriptional regulator
MNNSGPVRAKTRAAVMKALQESQYVSRRPASATGIADRKGSARLVEVVLHRSTPIERLSVSHGRLAVGPVRQVDDGNLLSKPYLLANSFYRRIIDGAVEELPNWQHRAVLQNSGNLLDAKFISELNGPDRAGILLLGEDSPDLGDFIAQCRHPVVLIDLIHRGWPDVITTDNMLGIELAFDHLYSQGHRRIGFVGRRDSNKAFAERFSGYQLKMLQAGLSFSDAWIHAGANHIDSTADGVVEILSRPDRPSAFLCANDFSALGVVRAAGRLHMSIPNDLSVVGFDDEDAASVVTPALTTVRVPMAEMGRQAVRQLMIQMQAGAISKTGCCIRLAPELIIRRSTAAIGI